ncbi:MULTISPECIES: autotransporter domain-containing protein [unclassified Variovorax]|uniref:autotransporter domain-containing protein n=1 Tax=unclassified Variovorax TaxID=663243 RepID=UPI0011133C9E
MPATGGRRRSCASSTVFARAVVRRFPDAPRRFEGVPASIEAGKPFALDTRWSIEPQVQIAYQRSRFGALVGRRRGTFQVGATTMYIHVETTAQSLYTDSSRNERNRDDNNSQGRPNDPGMGQRTGCSYHSAHREGRAFRSRPSHHG